jgi:hypothetical protein
MTRLLMTAGLVIALGTGVAGASETRAVFELFTSQGCSSCPPADELAADLARQPGTVVLSLPVDYWDYLGWKDTLASPAFTKRQKAYAAARGDRNVYTPQIVVNGLVHVVGSDNAALKVATKEAGARSSVLDTKVSIKAADGGFAVAIGEASGVAGEVWLMATESKAKVAIGRGENSGHSVTYTNVVRSMTKLGDYAGKAVSLPVSADMIGTNGVDGFAVLVQAVDDGKPGAILGAAAHSPLQRMAQP